MISPGCTNCYAMRMAARLQAMGMDKYRGTTRKSAGRPVWSGRVNFDERILRLPLRWRKPRLVFVNSMSDLFQDAVPGDFIRNVWETMEQAHWHTFQVLTKRPARMRDVIADLGLNELPNVWLGTSIENDSFVHRIAELRSIPAAVRFISFEPLLGSVGPVNLRGIDWAIVGGESGPGARPIDSFWVKEIHQACRSYGVAFFFKQWGGVRKKRAGRHLDGRTWDEMPRSFRPPTQLAPPA